MFLYRVVVSKMAYLAHFTNFKNSNTSNKIPEYAKDFKNEWLYIQGINKKCGEFMIILGDNTDSFEKVFWSSRAKALIEHFKDVLEAQKMGKLQNISKLKFKLSAVIKIINLRNDLYFHMGNTFMLTFLQMMNFKIFLRILSSSLTMSTLKMKKILKMIFLKNMLESMKKLIVLVILIVLVKVKVKVKVKVIVISKLITFFVTSFKNDLQKFKEDELI